MVSYYSADENICAFQLFIPFLTFVSLLETNGCSELSRRVRTAKIDHLHIYSLRHGQG
jgi:hypothetical protein